MAKPNKQSPSKKLPTMPNLTTQRNLDPTKTRKAQLKEKLIPAPMSSIGKSLKLNS